MLLLLSFSESAFGQICGMSEYPYGFAGSNRPKMHGTDFKNISGDLPPIAETEHKRRYSQFWINTDVLNVRTGPGLEYEIISEEYYGNLVFAFAKTGDWVAIGLGITRDNYTINPKWVHIKYLSSKRIEKQVSTEVLRRKCSFRQYGESSSAMNLQDSQNNIFNACAAVTNYLILQNYLSKTHDYYDEYFNWRSLKKNPENYRNLPCGRRR